MLSFGTGPQNLLSALALRLSPIMKYSPGGIVMSRLKVQSLLYVSGFSQLSTLLMYGSFRRLSLMYAWPLMIFNRSPGIPITRLMKFSEYLPGVPLGQGIF